MKYKIKVDFSRIYEVEAENRNKAEDKAREMGVEEVEMLTDKFSGDDLSYRLFEVKEYQEPINWREQAEKEGKQVAEDLEEEIKKAVADYKDKSGIKEGEDINEIAKEIYDDLYQDEDIKYKANEYADGQFIYNSLDAITEALQCIDRLSDYEETDNGLWEGLKTIEEQINARATFTYANAIYNSAEEAIKGRIETLLQNDEKEK